MTDSTPLLALDSVVLDLEASSKKRIFEHIGALFETHQGIAHHIVFDSLFAREKLGSTGLGRGIAIPHGRIKGIKDAQGVFMRLATPIPFDSPDGKPVQLLFALLVPEQATERHLQILSDLAERFSDNDFRDALMNAKTPTEIITLFTHPLKSK